jgi:hypothetical protein
MKVNAPSLASLKRRRKSEVHKGIFCVQNPSTLSIKSYRYSQNTHVTSLVACIKQGETGNE